MSSLSGKSGCKNTLNLLSNNVLQVFFTVNNSSKLVFVKKTLLGNFTCYNYGASVREKTVRFEAVIDCLPLPECVQAGVQVKAGARTD
ncbi:MAG: hypothetical protein AAGA86_11765, partial [Bacteroidota bacterium]